MENSSAPLTSEQLMNNFRFRDKMTLLNSEFISVLQHFFKEKNYYDFTSTMHSYIEHAKKLKVMYKLEEEEKKDSVEETKRVKKDSVKRLEPPKERKIAKAVRRTKGGESVSKDVPKPTLSTFTPIVSGGDKKVSDFASSSPVVSAASVPQFGDISMIPKETPVAEKKVAQKRAKTGGGILGGPETVIFKNTNGNSKNAEQSDKPKIPIPTIKLPEPTKDFWSKKNVSEDKAGSLFGFLGNQETPKFSGFAFGKKENDSKADDKESEKSDEKLNTSSDSSESPEKKQESEPKAKLQFPSFQSKLAESNSSDKPQLSFGGFAANKNDGGEKPNLVFGQPSSSTSESKKDDNEKPKLLFGSNSTEKNQFNTDKPKLSFGSFSADQKKDNSDKPKLSFPSSSTEQKKDEGSKPALSFPSFGSTTTSAGTSSTLSNSLTFGSGSSLFANLTQKAAENSAKADGADNEDEEYVPPKPEVTENVEPDAILSSKVSVFKFSGKEYKKLGVGMLHIKKTDEKHSVLIRAATTSGNVWLNSLCNAAMKGTKVTDDKNDKIRLTCPSSATEMTTLLIRFATPDGANKCLEKIEELAK